MTGSYEDPAMVAAYVLFHYGNSADTLGSLPGPTAALEFPQRCVRELIDAKRVPANARALDLGCAVGGSTFELSRFCHEAVGLDFSTAFIHTAEKLRLEHRLDVELIESADDIRKFQAKLPPETQPERIHFQQGDAMQLPKEWENFDIVLAANLLCRLPEPTKLLDRLPSLIPANGQLLLTTPFTWLESFTPRAHWIRGLDALEEILSPHFRLEHQIEMPFLIREHARKFQYGISQGTRWIRR